ELARRRVVAEGERAEALDGAPDAADDDAVPHEALDAAHDALAAVLGLLDRLAPRRLGTFRDLVDAVAVRVRVRRRLDVRVADDVVDRVRAAALGLPEEHDLLVDLRDEGVVVVDRVLVLVPLLALRDRGREVLPRRTARVRVVARRVRRARGPVGGIRLLDRHAVLHGRVDEG